MRASRLVAALLAVPVTGLLAGTATAGAAGDQLGLSRDGDHWSSSIPAVMPQELLVPGRSVDGTFAVKNRSNSPAVLRAEASTTDGDRLIASGALALQVKLGQGGWQPLTAGRLTLPANGRMPSGQAIPAVVRATLAGTSGNASQDRSASFSIRLVLSQTAGLDAENTGSGQDGGQDEQADEPGILPSTGAEIAGWWAVAGAGLLGIGVAVLGRRRENDEGTDVNAGQGASR